MDEKQQEYLFHRIKQKKKQSIVIYVLLIGSLLSLYGNLSPDSQYFLGVKLEIYLPRFWFMTNFSLLISMITLGLGTINRLHIVITKRKTKNVFDFIHAFFLSFIFYFEVFITLSFWPLFLYNPYSVFSKRSISGTAAITLFSNFCMHVFPVFFLGVDYFTFPKIFKEKKPIIGYTIILFSIQLFFRWYYDRWRYKFLLNMHISLVFILPFIVILSILIIQKASMHLKLSLIRSRRIDISSFYV
ncbi:hypothetical protein NEFER03_2121 [Nematocida sp. LUAm3]|nr:hypothetical protein NEFER03_2121 [Nematocida sp. LUAm3]KAI5175627.1 hypothetical protein NEFER02_1514 [Nematocida sp. LUAm2]KAI5178533.1 hypothetical protein NEFER01_1669 [Nematocida sp. LUAm1]